ncbi:transmembrane channel-like protein 7, partial [Sycon ciliatum]|uniref:transmembrane channel-like protein 7 n=1 Tax=Sycon ciliatum TaxID=27933 RepID=UPI0031F71E0D
LGISFNNDCLCWEVVAGQEIYQLLLVNFFTIILSSLSYLVWKALDEKWERFHNLVGPPTFNLAKNVLELRYTQALAWLGFFFSPFITTLCVVGLLVVFQVKSKIMIRCCKPSELTYRAARNSSSFIILLLFTLILCVAPLVYTIYSIQPSEMCGPFRARTSMISTLSDLIDSSPGWVSTVFNVLFSIPFIVPAFIVTLIVIYYYYTKEQAQKETYRRLKEQHQVETIDKQYLVHKIQGLMTVIADYAPINVLNEIQGTTKLGATQDKRRQRLEKLQALSKSAHRNSIGGSSVEKLARDSPTPSARGSHDSPV